METDNKNIRTDTDIAVINLDRRPDRMEYLYKNSPLSFRRFPAIDGKNLSKHYFEFSDLLDTIRDHPRVVGEVGCSLSHYSLWKGHAQNNRSGCLLVFEDDVMFLEKSRERFEDTIRDIRRHSGGGGCGGGGGDDDDVFTFDVMYLGGQWTPSYDIDGETPCYFPFQKTTRESLETHYRKSLVPGIYKRRNRAPAVIQGTRNVWYSPLFRTAGAYLVSQRGAKRLLDAVETDTALFMKTPLDMWLLEMDFRGYIDAYDRFPHPFFQAGFEMVREQSHAINDIHRGDFQTVELPPSFS